MDVTVAVTQQALTGNLPDNTLIQATFTYTGTTPQHGDTLYYAATISDNATNPNTENVLFPLTVTSGTNIPTTPQIFEFKPSTVFTGSTLSAGTTGKVFYTP